MNLHKAGSSAGFNIALIEKGRGKKKKLLQQRVFIFRHHPSINPAEQSLTLFSGRYRALSLWYDDSKLNA